MSITPKWADSYSPAEATRSSWVPLDMTTTTQYPSAGRGKMAQLNYIVGMDSSTPGASSSNPTYVNVVNPITLNGVISADLIEVDNLWFTTPVSASVLLPNSSVIASITLTPITSSVITFTPKIDTIEIFNNTSSAPAYVSFNTTTFVNLTSKGLPILEESYYSIDREITSVTVGTNGNSDLRIIGHRRI